jgi:hypothetical protein
MGADWGIGPQDCEMITLVAQDDWGARLSRVGGRYIQNVTAERVYAECMSVERRVVPDDENGALANFERSKKDEVGSFKGVSKSPAARPLLGLRVEP